MKRPLKARHIVLAVIGLIAAIALLWGYSILVPVFPSAFQIATTFIAFPIAFVCYGIFRALKRWTGEATPVFAAITAAVSSPLLVTLIGLFADEGTAAPKYIWAIWKIESLRGRVGVEELRGKNVSVSLGFSDGPKVTDADLACLEPFRRLYSFDLLGSQVTDAGLEHLRNAPILHFLHLAFVNVTDNGLLHLQGLTQLVDLDLTGTKITDTGVRCLPGFPELGSLYLRHTRVTDAGLKPLKKLAKLRYLCLQDTQVTDAGLEHLRELTQLEGLDLMDTRVTDAGLDNLKGLAQLTSLYLKNTRVTAQGVKKLEQALPKCRIVR
jgi:Leucine-rich repeat (LRR) protein